MIQKHFISILFLLCMLVIMSGCGADNMENMSSWEPTPTSFLDFLHAELSPETFTSHGLDNSTLSEEEYGLRQVINSLSMYHEVTGQEYEVEVDGEEYGIDDFSRNDDWYNFISINDMAIVFSNMDFQQIFLNLYGYRLDVDAYYLPPVSVIEKYNVITGPANSHCMG